MTRAGGAPDLDDDWSGRRVTVMGLGLFGGGASVARTFARRGARVTVTDLRTAEELAPTLQDLAPLDLRLVLGEHRLADFTSADLVVANPAVPPTSAFLQAAQAIGVPVTSEAALFLASCRARIAAVTGTQGKSSVCSTSVQLLRSAGIPARLGGNVGVPLLDQVEAIAPEETVVLELSSYQLEALPSAPREALPSVHDGPRGRPRVDLVCVTNVLADHLERHGSREAYLAAKRRILELCAPGGTAVLPGEDPELASWHAPGVARVGVHPTQPSETGLAFRAGEFQLDGETLGRVSDLRLPGVFQRENTLVALGIARLLGAEADRLAAAVGGLTALPHRMEDLGEFAGRRVWDNGVSTTPDSTLSALASLAPGCTLLCGGKAKRLPLEELIDAARERVRRVIAFGAAGEMLAEAFARAGIEAHAAETLDGAVDLAFERTAPGEDLLFSPACASFDAYANFRARALAFRAAVARRALPAGTTGSA